jgi:putative hydrolase of the HAD superfamily
MTPAADATDAVPAVRAVFFDVDFTLIFPGPTFQGEGYERFCRDHGVSVDAALFDTAVAASSFILDEVEEPIYDDNLFIHYTATIIEHMGGRGPGVIRAAKDIYRAWASNHHFELYDDVELTLEALAARGLIVGVISNSHRSLAAFSEHFALGRFITIAISSAEHGYMKPHASIFEAALARAGARADEAIMVGDSLRADVEGALAAGLRAVLIRRSGDRPEHLPDGVLVITSLHELPPLL